MNKKQPPDKNPSLPDSPPDDNLGIRCPRLGHQINFPYCRRENNGLPCFKTLDCWYTYFNVHAYLEEKLSSEDFERSFVKQSAPKIFSLLDLIEQAKKNKDKGSED